MEKKNFDAMLYLQSLCDKLLNECQCRRIEFTTQWTLNFPQTPGVYLFWDKKKIIYVGETGNLRGRMKDMTDTRNHTLRRSIGNQKYSTIKGFSPATSKQKFTDTIENMLNEHIQKNLTVTCMSVLLGRKELEEKIQKEFQPEYNRKGIRKVI